jgi:hypothetical protein
MNIIIIPACAIICLYGSRVEEQWMVIAWPQVRQVKREGRREESSPTPCEEEPLELLYSSRKKRVEDLERDELH